MKNIRYVFSRNLMWNDKKDIYINSRQLVKLCTAFYNLNAFTLDDKDIDTIGKFKVTYRFDGMTVCQDDDLNFQYIKLSGYKTNDHKNVMLPDYPQSIKSIFGLDYKNVVPAFIENAAITIQGTYKYTPAIHGKDDWGDYATIDAEVDDYDIDNIILEYYGKGNQLTDSHEMLDQIPPITQQMFLDMIERDVQGDIIDTLNEYAAYGPEYDDDPDDY